MGYPDLFGCTAQGSGKGGRGSSRDQQHPDKKKEGVARGKKKTKMMSSKATRKTGKLKCTRYKLGLQLGMKRGKGREAECGVDEASDSLGIKMDGATGSLEQPTLP